MADSKNKKTTTKPVTKATPKATKAKTSTSSATKSVTKTKTAAKKPETKVTEKKSVAASAAKTSGAASTKASSAKSEAPVKSSTKSDVKETVEKTTQNNTKKAASNTPDKTVKKEKGAGSGKASLALLFSMAALGLSGYSYYQQHLSPQVQSSQGALLSGVNEIKSNVTEFGTVVSGLQQEVKDFKQSQDQYITQDTLTSTVKESVEKAVQNLPDLPNIGPSAVQLEGQEDANVPNSSSGTDVTPESAIESAGESQQSGVSENSSEQIDADSGTGAEVSGASEDKALENTGVPGATTKAVSSGDQTGQDVETAEAVEDESFWSWDRAKKDLKEMLNSVIKIEKTEQN